MLELLTDTNEIIFTLCAVGTIIFSTFAVLSHNARSAIIHLLVASVFICGFSALTSDSIIAIILAVIYISVMTLLTTITNDQKPQCEHNNGFALITITVAFIISLLMYKQTGAKLIMEKKSSHYVGVAEITILVSMMFIFVISCITSFQDSITRRD